VGVLSASWFIPPSKLPTLPENLQVLLDEYEFVMPAFDFSAEWERFKSNIPEPWKLANDGREFLVGEEMKSRGLEAKYPVVLIPRYHLNGALSL
jgi:phospholipid:diacylglycerol acyltransferase